MTRNKSAIAYTGVRADTPPNFKTSNGPPDSEDFAEFLLGDFWLDLTNDDLYVLISKQGGSATWILLSGGSGSTITFNTDSGNAQPNTGVINVVGGANIDTSGAGSTVTVAVEDAIDLPDTTSASVGTYLFNGSRFMHAFGDNSNAFIGDLSGNFSLSGVNNTTVGQLTGTSLTTGFDNTIMGASAGASLTTGDNNAFFGSAAGGSIDTGTNNTYLGASAGSAATSGVSNVAIGDTALDQLTTGNRNIVVGATSGGNYTSSESDNILINSLGVTADNNVLRIGTDGTGNFEIDQAFIAGIWQRTPAGSTEVVTIDSNGELGSSAISPGGINDLQGDGGGTATGSTITIAGGANIDTTAGGSTVTVAVEDAIDLPDTTGLNTGTYSFNGTRFMHKYGASTDTNTFIGQESGNFSLLAAAVNNTGAGSATLQSLTDGEDNTGLGAGALGVATTADANTAVGSNSLIDLTTGNNNTALGVESGARLVTGSENVLIGSGAGSSLDSSSNVLVGFRSGDSITSGSNNLAVGDVSLSLLLTGTDNTIYGNLSGGNYTGSESSNILIANEGVAGESNVLRIGTDGTGVGQVDSAFIAGIWQRTPSGSTEVVTIDSNGELGSTAISPGGINDLAGDTGTATGSTITIAGGANIDTSAAGSTVTVAVEDAIYLPDTSGSSVGVYGFDSDRFIHKFGATTNAFIGSLSGNFSLTGDNNVGVGSVTGNLLTSGISNTMIGATAGTAITSGSRNSLLGSFAGGAIDTGSRNTFIGNVAGSSVTSGNSNISIGNNSLTVLTTGSRNIVVGSDSGGNYTSSESDNIIIGAAGVASESNVLRIGTDGTGNQEVDSAFIAGIWQRTPALASETVIIDSDGEMGTKASSEIVWNEITGTSAGMDPNNGYIANNAGQVDLDLPAVADLGTVIHVCGFGAGGWNISQNAGQVIHFGSSDTTTGTGGSLTSTSQYDVVKLLCVVDDTEFVVLSSVGNITVT